MAVTHDFFNRVDTSRAWRTERLRRCMMHTMLELGFFELGGKNTLKNSEAAFCASYHGPGRYLFPALNTAGDSGSCNR